MLLHKKIYRGWIILLDFLIVVALGVLIAKGVTYYIFN